MPTYHVFSRVVLNGSILIEADDKEAALDAIANLEDIDDDFRENADLVSALGIGEPVEVK